MDYIELNIPVADSTQAEIMTALLADFPFDSFVEENATLKAYIPKNALIECKGAIDEMLAEQGIAGAAYIEIETQNWNAIWESHFEPVSVDGECTIRAPFSAAPVSGMDIVIMPKMSFGTGHHATTYLMTAAIMERDFTGKRGLDMGSGTGVLAIAAVMRGAAHVDAVDIDDWAMENSTENIKVNGVEDRVIPILGDVNAISDRRYDFILANINRNILLADMERYAAALESGGELLMSGILERDIPAIYDKAHSLGFTAISSRSKDGWALVNAKW